MGMSEKIPSTSIMNSLSQEENSQCAPGDSDIPERALLPHTRALHTGTCTCMCIYMHVLCLSVCLAVCLSVCLFVCLSVLICCDRVCYVACSALSLTVAVVTVKCPIHCVYPLPGVYPVAGSHGVHDLQPVGGVHFRPVQGH